MCVMKVSNSKQNFIKIDGSIPDLYNNIYLKMSQVQRFSVTITKKTPHAIDRKFFGCKNESFHWKYHNFDIFLIFAQNIDCGYVRTASRRRF